MEVVLEICKTPKICLCRDSSGWIVADGIKESKTKDGSTIVTPKNPGYYGLFLEQAISNAHRRLLHQRADKAVIAGDLMRFVRACTDEVIAVLTDNNALLRKAVERLTGEKKKPPVQGRGKKRKGKAK